VAIATFCSAIHADPKQNARPKGRASSREKELSGSGSRQVASRGAARALVGHDLKLDLLALLECAQTGALDSGDMDEDVLLIRCRAE
jgi:hypothetical protein